MTTEEIAARVWAETRYLQQLGEAAGDSLDDACRLVARLAASDEANNFPLSVPPSGPQSTRAAAAALEASRNVRPGDKQPRLLLWSSKDGKLPDATPAPPLPWSKLDPAAIAPRGTFLVADKRYVTIFCRADGTDTAGTPSFASIVTGTGTTDGVGWLATPASPPPQPSPGNRPWCIGLSVLGLVLLLVGTVWSAQLGAALHRIGVAAAEPAECKPPDAACKERSQAAAENVRKVVTAPQTGGPGADSANAGANKEIAAEKFILPEAKEFGRGWVSDAQTWVARNSRIGDAFSAVTPLVMSGAAIVMLLAAAGMGITGNPLGALVDVRNRLSLTLVQLAGWTIVLLPGLIVLTCINIGFAGSLDFPNLQLELWGVIGLAALAPVASKQILGIGASATGNTPGTDTGAPSPPSAATTQASTVPSVLDKNASVEEAGFADLFVSERAGMDHTVDIKRVQFFTLTVVLLISYAITLFALAGMIDCLSIITLAHNGTDLFKDMPTLGGEALVILTVTHAALLGGKVLDTQADKQSQVKRER